jgi:hypothetical protein
MAAGVAFRCDRQSGRYSRRGPPARDASQLALAGTDATMSDHDPAAERAARDWLALTDGGQSNASWEAAATLFRRAVSAPQWEQALEAVRAPLGAVVSRRVESERAATELPGAPDGEYVVFQFATTFEHKRTATETVTPMRDTDGQWRVSGYFIR